MYHNGRGVSQSYAQAVIWYQKAAEQGDAKAQHSLGYMYETGQGVPQDYKRAVIWYQKAAEQESPIALSILGVMYAEGKGVPKSYKMAYILLNLAASKGSDSGVINSAIELRNNILNSKKITPIETEDAQRISTNLYNSKNFAADLHKLLNSPN